MRLSGIQVLGVLSPYTPAPPSYKQPAFTLLRLEAAENAIAKSETGSVPNFLRKLGRGTLGVEYEMEHSF
jgi:hypothetical protein